MMNDHSRLAFIHSPPTLLILSQFVLGRSTPLVAPCVVEVVLPGQSVSLRWASGPVLILDRLWFVPLNSV